MGYSNRVLQYTDELLHIFGKGNVFFDEEIRRIYAHDLSNPPWVMDYLIRRVPDAVCIARNKDQIPAVLKLASAAGIPVTPAAARSSAYGGSVPAKGGITLDLTRLNNRIEVNRAARTVTCEPGVVIWNLEKELNRYDLTLATYPTSAPSATIGGFVCQGGVGMGSFRHGPVAGQVASAELVLPTGDVRRMAAQDLDMVNECEGITGVVTEVTLKVEPKQERVPTLAVFEKPAQMVAAAKRISREFNPWNVTIHNPTFSTLREEAGGAKTVPKKRWSILAVFDKKDYEPVKADYQKAVEAEGGKLLPDATAAADWGEIFNTLRAKRLGPSIAPGEAIFPVGKMLEFLEEVEKKFDYAPLSMEITLMSGGNATILAFALDDERRIYYPFGFAAGIGMLKIAKKHGGRAYAPGLYLAAEARNTFGTQRYSRLISFKKKVDPSRIMNPGKIIGIRPRQKAWLLGIPAVPAPPGAPMSTVDRILNAPPMTLMMGFLAPFVKYNRPDDERSSRPAGVKAMSSVGGGSFGRRHDWDVYTCSQCMFCRDVAPMTHAVGNEAASPSGLIWAARLYLQGKLKPTKKLGDLVSAASESYVGDDVCPSRIPLSQVFKDWKKQLEHDLHTTLVTPPRLTTQIGEASKMLEERKARWATKVEAPKPPEPKPAAAAGAGATHKAAPAAGTPTAKPAPPAKPAEANVPPKQA